MLELLNIRLTFICRYTRKNTEGKSPIALRVIYRGERRDIYTGLYCEKEEWNSETSRLHRINKLAGTVNANLDPIQRKAFEIFEELKFSGLVLPLMNLSTK